MIYFSLMPIVDGVRFSMNDIYLSPKKERSMNCQRWAIRNTIIHTSKYILTDINNTRRLTNATTRYVEYTIKHIWMSIMHTHSAYFWQRKANKFSVRSSNLLEEKGIGYTTQIKERRCTFLVVRIRLLIYEKVIYNK